MNYTELCANIQDYTENTFTADELATFTKQAEQRIYNTVQLPNLRKNVTGATTTNNKYVACPTDFLSVYSFAVINTDGSYEYLLNKDVNFIREAYPIPTGSGNTGRPRHYAIFGPYVASSTISDELTFLLGPTPDTGYSVELHYYYYPESITVAGDGQTWLGDNFDTVLLYGALREAYFFIKAEQDMMAKVEEKYTEALALAKRLGDGMERQDAYRSGQVRYPVK